MAKYQMKCFAVLQAVRLKFEGVKTFYNEYGEVMSMFPDIESAQRYLTSVILHVKRDQEMGRRDSGNLIKEVGLDFKIQEVTIDTGPIPDKWEDKEN